MCYFILLVTDSPDFGQLKKTLARLGRNAVQTTNPAIQRLLKPRERQFNTSGVCDCGTILGIPDPPRARDLTKAIEDKRRLGWSDAKIERWVADQRKAESRPQSYIDSHKSWSEIISEVLALEGTSTAGIVVHCYDGAIDEEEFVVHRRETNPDDDLIAALECMPSDELMIVRRPSRLTR